MRLCLLALSLAFFSTDATMADDPKLPPPKPADGDAPLAKGFPDATKPGAIEVKPYPAYRSAVASVDKATMNSGDMMFFPLFNHIQKNKVEMTAPVISTFKTPAMIATPGAKGETSMEFVYRTPDLGHAGPDGAMIQVEDHPAQQFVCLGQQGDMNEKGTREGVEKLNKWLEEHKAEWVAAGPPRRLGYHGPMTPAARRLWEVQIPVKKADGGQVVGDGKK